MTGTGRKYTRRGFTLLELLVGMTLFLIVVSTVSGLSAFYMRNQMNTLLEQEALDEVSFSGELISRILRMTERDNNGTCTGPGTSFLVTRGGNGIKFINRLYNSSCSEIFLQNNTLYFDLGDGKVFPLTSPQMVVKKMNVVVMGARRTDKRQPLAVISLLISPQAVDRDLTLQITISQRDLDL